MTTHTTSLPPAIVESRRAFMENLVQRGLAEMDRDMTADEIAEMVCLSRRTWQRIMAGVDVPPRSVVKVFCLEAGLIWEAYDPQHAPAYAR